MLFPVFLQIKVLSPVSCSTPPSSVHHNSICSCDVGFSLVMMNNAGLSSFSSNVSYSCLSLLHVLLYSLLCFCFQNITVSSRLLHPFLSDFLSHLVHMYLGLLKKHNFSFASFRWHTNCVSGHWKKTFYKTLFRVKITKKIHSFQCRCVVRENFFNL